LRLCIHSITPHCLRFLPKLETRLTSELLRQMAIKMEAFNYFINSHQRLFWLYLLSSLMISAVVLVLKPEVRRLIFSKKLWLHTSAKLDYIYFVISLFIKIVIILPLMLTAAQVAYFMVPLLQEKLGYVERLHVDRFSLTLMYTFMLFVVSVNTAFRNTNDDVAFTYCPLKKYLSLLKTTILSTDHRRFP